VVLKERGHQFLPLFVITGVLLGGYSAPYAALWGIASVFPVAALRKTTRQFVRPKIVLEALVLAAKDTLTIATACAVAGIVIGVILLSGLAIEFTSFVVNLSQNNLVLALILTALAGIILGMGLPTTPAYIIQVALLVPAAIKLGVKEEAAHLFVFYYSCLSTITPPVALGVFAAKSIAGGNLWDTGWAAVKLGATGYVVPFMCVFGPALMLIGPWQDILLSCVTAPIGVICLAAGLHGYFVRATTWWERLILIAAALVLITPGLLTDLAGIALIALTLLSQKFIPRKEPAPMSMGADTPRAAEVAMSAGSRAP
jgi:TRAP transporter 4TM/12TM fusion protein